MKDIKKLKMGIVGHGFVGKATDWGFNKNVDKTIVDPIYKTTLNDLSDFSPDIIFVCVPTPMDIDGTQDSRILESVVREVLEKCIDSIIVIKSTVLPSTLEKLSELSSRLIYNPEFLREKHANEDFINSKMIILGGDKSIAEEVSKCYLEHSRCKTKEHIFLDIGSASFIKYAINTFLATKVIYFNELHKIFSKMQVKDDWETLIKTIGLDERIGSSHMNVPGHDGRKGFGGACFPKDSSALHKYSKDLNVENKLLAKVITINNQIRNQYEDLDEREKAQNVSFDDKI